MSETVDSLKQRLVGAFVILSLAVIFLPMLFDKPHREGVEQVELVPPKPKLETVVISRPKPLESEQKTAESTTEQSVSEKTPQLVPAAPQETESLYSESVAEEQVAVSQGKEAAPSGATEPKVYSNVWMVQLGTFSNPDNAYKLRDKLRGLGVDGHTKPIESGKAIRVFAGPFVTKKEALRVKRKVDAEFKIESLVVFFEA